MAGFDDADVGFDSPATGFDEAEIVPPYHPFRPAVRYDNHDDPASPLPQWDGRGGAYDPYRKS